MAASRNSIDAYGAAGKTNVLTFDPSTLTIITDPQHALYDSRVDLPLDEAMVLNIMDQGVHTPILISKDRETGKTIVVAGRQRVRHAIEANKRLAAKGLPPLFVPAVVRKGKDAELMGVMASENDVRRQDGPVTRAEKMQRFIDRGHDEAQIALAFGCNIQTVKNTLALLECSAQLRNAVDGGKITMTTAAKLFKLPAEDQRAKVQEVIAATTGTTGHERAAKTRAAVGKAIGGAKMRGRKEVTAMFAQADKMPPAAIAALAWVLGQSDETAEFVK